VSDERSDGRCDEGRGVMRSVVEGVTVAEKRSGVVREVMRR
jgi:hypothetical protein